MLVDKKSIAVFVFSSILWVSQLSPEEIPSKYVGELGTILLGFQYDQSSVELKNITFYDTKTRIKRITISKPWKAILLDSSGNEIFSLDFPNPTIIFPRDDTHHIEFTVRIPYLKKAAHFQLKDDWERLLHQIELSKELLQRAKKRGEVIQQNLKMQEKRIEQYYDKFGRSPAKVKDKGPEMSFLSDPEGSGNIGQQMLPLRSGNPLGIYDLSIYAGERYHQKWLRDISITDNSTMDIVLDKMLSLRITVYDNTVGNPVKGTGVQVKDPQTDQALEGNNTDSNGVASVTTPDRSFNLIVQPPDNTPLLKKTLENLNTSGPSLDITLERGYILSGTVYDRYIQGIDAHVIAYDSNFRFINITRTDSSGHYSLPLPQGTWTILAKGALYQGTKLVTISSDMVLDLQLTEVSSQTVSGTIKDSNGNSITGTIAVYNEEGESVCATTDTSEVYNENQNIVCASTDTSGQFKLHHMTIPLMSRGFGIIYPPANSRFLLETFEITAGMSWDFVLDSLPSTREDNPLSLIYGDSDDRRRLNFVIIGDGYTDLNEGFTDSNGNGEWDGDIYLDENGNGQYDAGEYYNDRNGNKSYDSPEPFTDSNSDRVCNRDEQGIFDQNALDLARSLLGSPILKEYADKINVWKVRLVSNQTCGDFPQYGITRDTALDTFYGPGGTIGIDDTKAAAIIQALLPEYDYIITLSYFPQVIGRANAAFGGRVAMSGGNYSLVSIRLAHEIGHSIGLLADEYPEYIRMYPSQEPSFPNVTTVLDATKIKWKDYLTLGTPSPPFMPGVGAFEGADYYWRGVYRPAFTCMMRYRTPRYCPICRDELIARLNELTSPPEVPTIIYPPDEGIDIPLDAKLDWGDSYYATSYNVYFGTSSPPPLFASDVAVSNFKLPKLVSGTDYYWQIVAKNDRGSTPGPIWHFRTVIVINAPPIAKAGSDKVVATGSGVILDGSGSSDPDGNTLNYSWSLLSKPAGSGVAIADNNNKTISFVTDKDGIYKFQLMVNDGEVQSSPDYVTVRALGQENKIIVTTNKSQYSPGDALDLYIWMGNSVSASAIKADAFIGFASRDGGSLYFFDPALNLKPSDHHDSRSFTPFAQSITLSPGFVFPKSYEMNADSDGNGKPDTYRFFSMPLSSPPSGQYFAFAALASPGSVQAGSPRLIGSPSLSYFEMK